MLSPRVYSVFIYYFESSRLLFPCGVRSLTFAVNIEAALCEVKAVFSAIMQLTIAPFE